MNVVVVLCLGGCGGGGGSECVVLWCVCLCARGKDL
jgi:hypothetical protein